MAEVHRQSRCADRRTKMDADKESRSRQYDGTAMSDDEVSKVYKIHAFGFLPKATINKMLIIKVYIVLY